MDQADAAFDADFYRATYPDLAHFGGEEAWDHYQRHGREEGRWASPVVPTSPEAEAAAAADPLVVFDEGVLMERAQRLRAAYAAARPFPHVVIDDFLPQAAARRILEAFPSPDDPVWLDWRMRDRVHQPRKQGIGNAERLGGRHTYIQHVMGAFNSSPMVRFLETLTGIGGLIPDPHLVGGGLHQILPGGRLALHSDFNFHPVLRVYRRLNLLLYLNPDWREEWGGDLELWDAEVRTRVRSVPPVFNRVVIFNTDRDALHGHPEPLRSPDGVPRRSLALYYYTVEGVADDLTPRETGWRLRPGETERTD